MGRVVIEKGPIEIAYGLDHATGYFISEYDVSGEDERPIFDAHTGPGGLGIGVNKSTMMEYWMNYGVRLGHVQAAWRGEEVDPSE
jgi:hypothetical protein